MSAPQYIASGGRGVYAIQCVDGRAYVGSSSDLRVRKNNHIYTLRRGKHGNLPLQEAWDALGEDAFTFVTLEQVPVGDLFEAEQRWMDQSRRIGDLFNRAPKAGSTSGLVHTEASCARFAAARAGMTFSPKHRANISAALKGKPLPDAHCAKISAAKTGEKNAAAKVSEADVRKIRQLAAEGLSQRVIGERFGITSRAVSAIVTHRNWSHVKDQAEAA